MVEITDSRMNFFVNSEALSFLGVSSVQTGNRVGLHTEASPGGRAYTVLDGGPPSIPPSPAVRSSCTLLHNSQGGGLQTRQRPRSLPSAPTAHSRVWAVPLGAGAQHTSKHKVKAPGEQMDGTCRPP